MLCPINIGSFGPFATVSKCYSLLLTRKKTGRLAAALPKFVHVF